MPSSCSGRAHQHAGVAVSKRELRRLKRIAAAELKDGRPLLEDPSFAARIAQVEIDLMALEITNLRVVSAEKERRAPGPRCRCSRSKDGDPAGHLRADDARGRDQRAAIPLGGPRKHGDPSLGAHYCNLRKASIYGGSNEIQKNIIAQTIWAYEKAQRGRIRRRPGALRWTST